MERDQVVNLLQGHLKGILTRAERVVLEQWADEHPSHRALLDRVSDEAWLAESLHSYDSILATNDQVTAERLAGKLLNSGGKQATGSSRFRYWLPYAAAVLAAIVIGTLRYFNANDPKKNLPESAAQIQPGAYRAMLTSAGNSVQLSSDQSGIILSSGEVTYLDGTTVGLPLADTVTLTTPRGGTYQVTLPDGSKIWLNAASTLKYPSRFGEDARQVTFSGEGYFEIAPDARRPFRVVADGQRVDVLGTEFNISAYPDDPDSRITLVEGKVGVVVNHEKGADQSVNLSPSEQARISAGRLSKSTISVDKEIAWRAGLFAFRNEPLTSIMRKIARWYDVHVEFKGRIEERTFTGVVSRDAAISNVLQTLALTEKVQFEIQGKTIVVKPTSNR